MENRCVGLSSKHTSSQNMENATSNFISIACEIVWALMGTDAGYWVLSD